MRVVDNDVRLMLLEKPIPRGVLLPRALRNVSNLLLQRCYVDSRIGFGVLAKRAMTRQGIFDAPEDD